MPIDPTNRFSCVSSQSSVNDCGVLRIRAVILWPLPLIRSKGRAVNWPIPLRHFAHPDRYRIASVYPESWCRLDWSTLGGRKCKKLLSRHISECSGAWISHKTPDILLFLATSVNLTLLIAGLLLFASSSATEIRKGPADTVPAPQEQRMSGSSSCFKHPGNFVAPPQ